MANEAFYCRDEKTKRPVFAISLKDGKLFRFGIGKACLILKHLDTLREFVDKYSKPDSGG